MNIPSLTNEYKLYLFAFLLYSLAVWSAGWIVSNRYYAPQAVPQIAHDQQDLGHGNVLAAKVVERIQPETVVPQGFKAQATAHIVVAGSKPVAVPDVHIAPTADSGELAFTDNADGSYSASPKLMQTCAKIMTCQTVTLDETLVKDKAGQEDLIVSDQTGSVQATFNAGTLSMAAKPHPWALGVARPFGIPMASQYGLAAAYSFQGLPVTVGADVFTTDSRPSGVLTAMVRF